MDIAGELGLVREATARLLADLKEQDATTLSQPSRTEGRSRLDVLEHLSADARTRAGDDRVGDSTAGIDAVAELDAACDHLADTWAVRSPDSWGRRLDGMRRGASRAASEPAARLVEVLLGHIDMGIGCEASSWTGPQVDVALGHVMTALSQKHSRVNGDAAIWKLHRTDPGPEAGSDWVVIRASYGTEIHPVPADADATITGPGHALMAWLTGRVPLAESGLEVTGDTDLAETLPITYPY